MITIRNETGVAYDTKVLDENGNDVTSALSINRLQIDIVPDNIVVATLHCICAGFELQDVVLTNTATAPGGKYHVHRVSNYFEMKRHGYGRIN